jgi:hypothetical protein
MATHILLSEPPALQKQFFIPFTQLRKFEMKKSSKGHLDALDQISRLSTHAVTQQNRTMATDWKTETFRKPVTSAWDLPLPFDQVSILLRGFRPRGRQDKWFVYTDEPNENGYANLHTFGSWTGFKMAEVTIYIPPNETSGKPPRITQIIWESDEEAISGNSEERAKQNIRELYTWVLAKQQTIEETILVEQSPLTKANSWRSGLGDRLAKIDTALKPTPPPPPPVVDTGTWEIVDVPELNIAIRPEFFYCPPSP